jgi:RimJ/RimL family protein N-acetyltransferase
VLVVHTFMVHPAFARAGYGVGALAGVRRLAEMRGCLCVRLDTYTGNTPARALYERAGYRLAGLIDLGLGHVGLHQFCAYELPLTHARVPEEGSR